MADLIFGLLHTEDTLTLRVAGIMIDPFHPVPPLSFRMGFMLKAFSGHFANTTPNTKCEFRKSTEVYFLFETIE